MSHPYMLTWPKVRPSSHGPLPRKSLLGACLRAKERDTSYCVTHWHRDQGEKDQIQFQGKKEAAAWTARSVGHSAHC